MADLDSELNNLNENDSEEQKEGSSNLSSPAKSTKSQIRTSSEERFFEDIQKYFEEKLPDYSINLSDNNSGELLIEKNIFDNQYSMNIVKFQIDEALNELKEKHLIYLNPSLNIADVENYIFSDEKKYKYTIDLKEPYLKTIYKKSAIKNSELLYAFRNFASLILSEPYLYLDTEEEVNAEINRIRKELYDLEIYPCFYSFIESSMLGKDLSAVNINRSIWTATKENADEATISFTAGSFGIYLYTIGTSLTALVSGGILVIIGGAVGAVYLIAGGDEPKLNLLRITKAIVNKKNIFVFNKEYEIKVLEIIGDIQPQREYMSEIGDNSLISKAIEKNLKYNISKHSTIKLFEDEILKSQVASKISNLLSTNLKEKINQNEAGQSLSALFSNELIGSEYTEYMEWLLQFPNDNDLIIDDTEASDVFDIDEDENFEFSLEESKENLYWRDDHKVGDIKNKLAKLFDYQVNDLNSNSESSVDKYFESRKAKLQADQNKKLAILKSMYEILLEDAAILNFDKILEEKPELAEVINESSVFKLLEDSAYPDILTPLKPLIEKRNLFANKYAPWFYYFDGKTNNNVLKKEKEIVKNILKTSSDFKNKLKDPDKVFFGGASSRIPDRIDYWSPSIFAQSDDGEISTEIKHDDLKFANNTIEVPKETIAQGKENIEEFLERTRKAHEDAFKKASAFKKEFGNKYFDKIDIKETSNEKLNGILKNIIPEEKNLENQLEQISDGSFEYYEKFNGIKGAFPTFRLYIVEEDAIYSSRYLAYDDFFNYNSVISFTVNHDKNRCASTANIQLQNISGILDGTKKVVKRDIDFERKDYRQEDDDTINSLTESIVLRKGINVQLRAGYGATTEDLDTLISGRITEINYSNDSMICNITVQSYGVELEVVSYGEESKNNRNNTFKTTHQLLGSLVLSKELKHFGRIRKGKVFQTGENMSPSLDTEHYYDSDSYDYNYTYGLYDFYKDNEGLILFGSIFAGQIIKAAGKGVSFLGKTFMGKALSKGINSKYVAKAVELLAKGNNYLTFKEFSKAWASSSGFGAKLGTVMGRGLITTLYQVGIAPIRIIKNIVGVSKASSSSFSYSNGITRKDLIEVQKNLVRTQSLKGLDRNLKRKLGQFLRGNNINVYKNTEGIEAFIAGQLRTQTTLYDRLAGQYFSLLGRGGGIDISIAGAQGYFKGIFSMNTLKKGISSAFKGAKIGATISVSAFILDLAVGFFGDVGEGIGNSWESIKNYFMDNYYNKKNFKTKVLLAPQDDNLFCPDPKTYIKNEGSPSYEATRRAAYIPASIFNFNSFGSVQAFEYISGTSYFDIDIEEYTNIQKFFDKRLNGTEAEFKLTDKTIWQVFEECTLRHPGYVRAVRPYGGSMEYRVFFGLPSQRYWSKDISLKEVNNLNKIFDYVKNSDDSNETIISEELLNFLYKSKIDFYKKITKKENQKLDSNGLKFFSNMAFNEFLEKTKDRFIPLRRFFRASSKSNLIQNNIVVSDHNVINSATVHYYSGNRDGVKPGEDTSNLASLNSFKVNAHGNIPDNLIKPTAVKSINIRGAASAFRYGLSTVLEGMKNIYEGNLLLLGNAKIMPLDAIILDDNITKMYGPLEVKGVNHIFSHETGFLTDIEVQAMTTYGSDNFTYPMMNASVLYQAKEAIFNRYNSKKSFKISQENSIFPELVLDTEYENLIEDIIDDVFSKENLGQEVSSNAKKELVKEFKERVKERIDSEETFFLQDIINEDFELPSELQGTIENVGGILTLGGLASGLGGAAKDFFSSKDAIRMASRTRYGAAITALIGLGIYAGSDNILDLASASVTSGMVGKNIFRPMILSKADNSSLVEVYPLVKDGVPLLAGGLQSINGENQIYQALGNVFTQLSDGYQGYLKKEKEINSLSEEAAYSLGSDNIWSTYGEVEIDGEEKKILVNTLKER